MTEEAYNRMATRDASMPMPMSPTAGQTGQTGASLPREVAREMVHFAVSSVPAGVSHAHPGPGAPALLHFEQQPVHFERHQQQGPVHRRSNSWGASSWQVASLLPSQELPCRDKTKGTAVLRAQAFSVGTPTLEATPQSSKYGTYKIVKASIWPWRSGKSP